MIGHRGAAAVAPENTLASLQAAVDAGADLVEFDVDRGLVVGHPGRPAGELTLDGALRYLATAAIGVHLDLKVTDVEREIAALARRHGVAERAVVSTTSARSLRQLRVESPEIARAISYPRDRTGAGSFPWPRRLVHAARAAVRPYMLVRIPRLIASAEADAVSLHHGLVTPRVVAAVHARGASLIAWTVDNPARIAELAAMGVDAIVSDNPGATIAFLAKIG